MNPPRPPSHRLPAPLRTLAFAALTVAAAQFSAPAALSAPAADLDSDRDGLGDYLEPTPTSPTRPSPTATATACPTATGVNVANSPTPCAPSSA
jgi:hypothetical protein